MGSVLSAAALAVALLAPAAAQTGALAPEWEVRKDLDQLSERMQSIQPALEKTNPQEWVERGAPAGYADQLKRILAEIGYASRSNAALRKQPERLTAALETFFRLQALDQMLRSYVAGVYKYQNPAIAELLQAAVADIATDREKLRQYVVELAAAKETELKIMDQEAQRCRSLLLRQPRSAR
jgi:hypothetical protein